MTIDLMTGRGQVVRPRTSGKASAQTSGGHGSTPVLVDRPVGRNPFTGLFLWFAGVDPRLLDTRVERYRYVGIGVFIVLIAAYSGVMFALFASRIKGEFNTDIVPFAVGWAVLILWADRSIIAEPNYGDLSRAEPDRTDPTTGANQAAGSDQSAEPSPELPRRRRRAFQYLMRVIIAVGGAVLVTEAALMLIFQSEIDRELDAMHTEQVRAAQQVELHGETAQIKALRLEQEANRARATAADAAVRVAADAYAGEAHGTSGTRRPGVGPVARQREAELNRLRAVAEQTRADVAASDADIDRRVASLEQQRTERISASAGAIGRDRGWLTQTHALRRVLDANDDNWLVAALPWVLRVVLLAIDLLPVSLKLLGQPTLYDRRLRAQAWLAAYRTEQLRRAERGAVDQLVDLNRMRANTLYDLAREEENFKKSAGLSHLRNAGW